MPETLKQRIHKGEIVVGVVVPVGTNRSRLEEILSKDSYDWISVDSQHSPLNEERLAEFCEMAADLGMRVQLRIKHTRHTYLIGNYLDLGPSGVEVPQVEEESTVDEALDYFYFPQVGKRSWGGVRARIGYEGSDNRVAYAEWWTNYGMLWMQIESIEAITKVRKLAKPGVDCLSWGPEDLSFSRESHPDHPLKTDDDCVRYVLKQLEGSDVKLAYRSSTPDRRNRYVDMGVTVLLERPRA